MFLSISRLSHLYWLVLSLPWRKPGQPALPSYSSLRTTVICPQLSRTFWGNHFFLYHRETFCPIFTFPWNVYSFLQPKFKLLYFFFFCANIWFSVTMRAILSLRIKSFPYWGGYLNSPFWGISEPKKSYFTWYILWGFVHCFISIFTTSQCIFGRASITRFVLL